MSIFSLMFNDEHSLWRDKNEDDKNTIEVQTSQTFLKKYSKTENDDSDRQNERLTNLNPHYASWNLPQF